METLLTLCYHNQQQTKNLPFVVMELPDISATDEQCIDHMYRHHSPLTFALFNQQ